MAAPVRPGRSTAALALGSLGAGVGVAVVVVLAVTQLRLLLTVFGVAAFLGAAGGVSVLRHRRTERVRVARLREIAHLERVDVMSGTDFEFLTADLLRRDGYRSVQVVGRAGDRGVDVLAVAPDGRRIAVQCKRQKANVGADRVRNLIGAVNSTYKGRVGVLVTNASFTGPARAEAAGHLVLIGRAELARWMDDGPLAL